MLNLNASATVVLPRIMLGLVTVNVKAPLILLMLVVACELPPEVLPEALRFAGEVVKLEVLAVGPVVFVLLVMLVLLEVVVLLVDLVL